MPAQPCFSAQQFSNFILTELPIYVEEKLRDLRPTDGLDGHISKGTWEAFKGVQQYQDRFRNVKANVAKAWEEITDVSCSGNPCDPVENEICWGWDRVQFGQERQSWKSQMLCFDQIIRATDAVEHFEQIVSDVLMPARRDITSFWVRKKALDLAGKKWLANATMSDFTWTWNPVGNEEVFATPSAWPTSKLTPEMIQRRIPYLRNVGYFGKWTNDPFWGGYDQFAELITDDETVWSLDKIATNQRVSDLWRFQMWSAAHEYYKYGMGGQIGNYMTHVDPFTLRFNRRGNQAQLVLPFKNLAATVGLGSTPNEDYLNAQYQISFIWHRFAWQMLVADMESVNPMMPFMVRDLSGQWNFATNDLGQDCEGNAIANYRKNKGFFYADFQLAAKPMYTEFMEAIFHKREPMVVYTVDTCATDPGYPEQTYNSACDGCETTFTFTPDADDEGNFVLAANTVTCDDEPLENDAIEAATLSALVTAMNNDAVLGALGTWSASGTQLVLSDATCMPILPWVV